MRLSASSLDGLGESRVWGRSFPVCKEGKGSGADVSVGGDAVVAMGGGEAVEVGCFG